MISTVSDDPRIAVFVPSPRIPRLFFALMLVVELPENVLSVLDGFSDKHQRFQHVKNNTCCTYNPQRRMGKRVLHGSFNV